jgi:hypothetical protein
MKWKRPSLGFRHTDIAADLFEKWKFPVALSQNVVYHHRPLAAQDPAKAAIIHLSDIIAHSLAEGKSGEWRVPTLDTAAWDKAAAFSTNPFHDHSPGDSSPGLSDDDFPEWGLGCHRKAASRL